MKPSIHNHPMHETFSIDFCLENWHIESSNHPLEVDIKFIHNHMINLAESLSFHRFKGEVKEQFLELFRNGHSPVLAIYSYEDKLHISAENEYRDNMLGSRNGSKMFERLAEVIGKYNNSGNGRAIMQEYDKQAGKAFIHCVVTGLMYRVHEKILQAGKLCYINASASFEPLNTSITLLYTSCAAGALPLGILITSDES
ncbi:hypothetical protein GLOIN_2v1471620 [Rhizophagus irregularis DAOM 181602=DAOM 197198]|nr:hypothetical protein GLOIN_2v1471620 [Rhizophagus irregularis DAOM 181602=DAOM 197198]